VYNVGMQNALRSMVILALGAAALLPGCSDDSVSSRLPEVVNVKDRFHLRMDDVKNHDTLLVYYWPMDGTSANIDQSAAIEAGRVSIIVEDNSQVTVYQTDMKQNGSFTTTLGLPVSGGFG